MSFINHIIFNTYIIKIVHLLMQTNKNIYNKGENVYIECQS
jgi:hypothetical protein